MLKHPVLCVTQKRRNSNSASFSINNIEITNWPVKQLGGNIIRATELHAIKRMLQNFAALGFSAREVQFHPVPFKKIKNAMIARE
jgi:hypothetical protein